MQQTLKEQLEALLKKEREKLLSRREAAEMLGVTVDTLATWKCKQRYDLPVVMIGRLPKYRLADLLAFIERNTLFSEVQ